MYMCVCVCVYLWREREGEGEREGERERENVRVKLICIPKPIFKWKRMLQVVVGQICPKEFLHFISTHKDKKARPFCK